MREEPWRRNRRIRNSGRRRGRGNREQQRQRRERQHQPRKRLRREPEREADIEDFSPWWRRNRAGAPRGGKTAGTPLAGLLWRRQRRDSSGSSVSGAAAQRTSAQRFVTAPGTPGMIAQTAAWTRDGSFVSATAAMWRDIPLAPEGLHDSRASGPRGRLRVFRGLYGPLWSDGFRRIG